jgi:tight adherence protein B
MSILLALLGGIAAAALLLYLVDGVGTYAPRWLEAIRASGRARGAVKIPSFITRMLLARKMSMVRTQLPQALNAMGTSVRAGLSLAQALEAAASRVPDPLGRELGAIAEEGAKGGTMDKSLASLEERLPIPEIQLLSACLRLARSTGGNLAPLLDQLTETMRERERLRGHVRALTSQGRLSAMIIGAMPFVLIGVMLAVDPSFIMPMFSSPIGWAMLGVALFLEVLGMYVLSRIAGVEP